MEASRDPRRRWDRWPVKTRVGAVELFGGGGFGRLLSPLVYSLQFHFHPLFKDRDLAILDL